MAHEQCFNCSTSSVHGGKRTKNHRRVSKTRRIDGNAKQLINTRQPRRRAVNGILCRRKPIEIFIPRWGAREQKLYQDTDDIQITKALRKHGHRAWGSKQEHNARTDSRGSKMHYAIGKPCHDIEEGVLVG